MKKLLYIFIIFLVSCKKTEDKPIVTENVKQDTLVQTVPVYEEVNYYSKPDTLVKISKPFVVNNIKCYWELTGIADSDYPLVYAILELKNYKNNKVLLSREEDFYDRYYFEDKGELSFQPQDVNFDGFKDFVFRSHTGSGSGGTAYLVYFFDNNKKVFDSIMEIGNIEIDNINKTISGSWKSGVFDRGEITHYFGNNGKVKYSEHIMSEKIEAGVKITSEKIINNKTIETKTDTISEREFMGGL